MLTLQKSLTLSDLLRELQDALLTLLDNFLVFIGSGGNHTDDNEVDEHWGEKGNNRSFQEGTPLRNPVFGSHAKKTGNHTRHSKNEQGGQPGSINHPHKGGIEDEGNSAR